MSKFMDILQVRGDLHNYPSYQKFLEKYVTLGGVVNSDKDAKDLASGEFIVNRSLPQSANGSAGNMIVSVVHVKRDDEGRQCFAYSVILHTEEGSKLHIGHNLHSGVDEEVNPLKMLTSLVDFLQSAGAAHDYKIMYPDTEPENLDLFPDWVAEAAYRNADELSILSANLDRLA